MVMLVLGLVEPAVPITTLILSVLVSLAMSKTRSLPVPPSMVTGLPLVFRMVTLLLMMLNAPAVLFVAGPGRLIR
jgi:hypothetical protein